MNDALGVGVLQSSAHLFAYRDDLLEREAMVCSFIDRYLDVASGHQRHHHVRLAALLPEVVYVEDVRVVSQVGHGLGLAGDA